MRLARVVALVVAEPAAVAEHRSEVRATCLESLRTLSRTHDALFDMVRHTDDLRVRQGIELLDALGVALTDEAEIVRLRAVSAIVPRGAVADA